MLEFLPNAYFDLIIKYKPRLLQRSSSYENLANFFFAFYWSLSLFLREGKPIRRTINHFSGPGGDWRGSRRILRAEKSISKPVCGRRWAAAAAATIQKPNWQQLPLCTTYILPLPFLGRLLSSHRWFLYLFFSAASPSIPLGAVAQKMFCISLRNKTSLSPKLIISSIAGGRCPLEIGRKIYPLQCSLSTFGALK